jgi:carboxylesterase type B
VLPSTATLSEIGIEVQSALGCPVTSDFTATLTCLRSASVADILAVQSAMPYFITPRPGIDGVFIKEQPLALLARGIFHRGVTVVGGTNLNESTILDGQIPVFNNLSATPGQFYSRMTSEYGAANLPTISYLYNITGTGPLSLPTPYAGIAKADSDYSYTCPVFHYLRLLSSFSQRVYYYQFVHHAPFGLPPLGSFHTSGLAYIFGHPCIVTVLDPQPPLQSFGPMCSGNDAEPTEWDPATNPGDADLSAKMMLLWGQIAKTGHPHGVGIDWPTYHFFSGYTNLVMDVNHDSTAASFSLAQEYNLERCTFWDSILPAYCGDDICQSNENVYSCPLDCH